MVQPERLGACGRDTCEFMMQRKLLGFGALVAWMILFHLLVNVWLLCLFTSLLVVIGGWLGSQAILDSESVIHLEHFVTLNKIQSSAESELQLDYEIRNTVSKIIRDFVSSWYKTVSSEHEFEEEVHSAMISMAMELKRRAQKVDRKALTLRTLDLCGCHLQSYLRAKEIMAENAGKKEGNDRSLWDAYSKCFTAHPALQSSTVEVNYARAIVDMLLHVLVPPPHLETRTGRFVVCELITCNILLPLIGKLSDPDWLNMLIVDVFNKSNKSESVQAELSENLTLAQVVPSKEDSPQELETASSSLTFEVHADPLTVIEAPVPELVAYDVIDSAKVYCPQNIEEEEPRHTKQFPSVNTRRYLKFGKSNPFYQETDADLESPPSDLRRSSLESLVLIGTEEAEKLTVCPSPVEGVLTLEDEVCPTSNAAESLYPKVVVAEIQEASDADGTEELSSSFCSLQELEKSPMKAGLEMMGVEQCLTLNPSGGTESLQDSPSAGTLPLSPFTFEPLNSPEGPVSIQNLRITGTITAKEHRGTGSHPYTLYTVKYETAVESENPSTVQPVAYHMVNRRYSEFLNLQTRLEERSELRKILKHVKGPKKIFPDLPFGNMDSDKVEARKSLLETFLRQLCAIPETANSEEMQEFLALNTDARIAFVKKPFIVSRIDKIVVNAIVDTLKTAFPRPEQQSPTDEVDAEADGKLFSDRKTKSRMRFASKLAPTLNVSNMRPKVLYCFDECSTVFNGFTLSGLESFISEKEGAVSKAAVREAGVEGEGSAAAGCSLRSCPCAKDASHSGGVRKKGETELADMVLDVLGLLMKDQWSWLCTENIQKSIRLLFGTLIDRWLEVGVSNLTCKQYWVIYLRVLQEAVWPGGRLPARPRPHPTQQQRDHAKRQCLHCLMKLLPDLVSDMLGSEKYMHTWQTVLDSLQDPTINRHLVYCVWDLLLEFLIPELSEEEFQRTLLRSLSKNAEKLPP